MSYVWGVAVGLVAALTGCADSVPIRAEYQLVFEDDFGGASIDSTKWTVVAEDACPPPCVPGARYAAANVTVANGMLTLAAGNEAGSAVSAAVHSAAKFNFRYGRVEVRARVPVGAGVVAAARLLPAEERYGPWPLSGEISIVESFANNTDERGVRGATRYGLPRPPWHGAAAPYAVLNPATALVDYAVEWAPGELRFFVNGDHVQTQTANQWFTYYPSDPEGGYDPLGVYRTGPFGAPFDHPFHLAFGAAGARLPQRLEVDYVRVYQCASDLPGDEIRCGSRNPSVTPLRDNAGGPLASANTGNPFRERLDLYDDGPRTVALGAARRQLRAGFASDDHATVAQDPHANDAGNTVWRVAITGGAGEAHLTAASSDAGGPPAIGFDFSGNRLAGPGGDPVGEIAFDMRVVRLGADVTLAVGVDSGYPGGRRFELPRAALAEGEWRPYSVKFADLAPDASDNCCGTNLGRVVRPFALRASGEAELLLDNIRVTNACRVVDACGADVVEAPNPRAACAAPGAKLRFGFYAFFAPVSYSADADPTAPGHRVHRGFEADLLTALEALAGAELAFDRHPIGVWTDIWLQSATADFDVVGGGITILESRTRDAAGRTRVRFTDGHIAFRQSLLVRAEDAERLATHAKLTSAARVGALADTTGEARLLQLTELADANGVLAAGTRVRTPRGVVTADGTAAYRITPAATTDNMVGRTRLLPPDATKPEVRYLGYERGEIELLEALADGAIDAVARGEIGNSDAAAASDGRFVVTALDPHSEFGGFTVAADNTTLLQCLNDKIRWLTNGGRIGYAQWRADTGVFTRRAEVWGRGP